MGAASTCRQRVSFTPAASPRRRVAPAPRLARSPAAAIACPPPDALTGALQRAVAERSGSADPLLASPPAAGLLQRKVELKPAGDLDAASLLAALRRRRAILPQEDQALVADGLAEATVAQGLARLRDSAVDYGTFDLTHDQDLALLYYELRKHVVAPPKAPDPATEVATTKEQVASSRAEFRGFVLESPMPQKTFDLALLGTGASIAYYITTNRGSIDKEDTVVIGERQPWAGQRGPGVVNHPLHMITAKRDAIPRDESLTPRQAFSDTVQQVIDENVRFQVAARIEKIAKIEHTDPASKRKRAYYKIDIDWLGEKMSYYARRVVAGLGIGPHLIPTQKVDKDTFVQEPLGGRAMNMDEFQRRADEIRESVPDPAAITVVIAGPNAGIDAVKTAILCGFTIKWVKSRARPPFLPGTDNELVEAEYDKRERGDGSSKIAELIDYYAYLATATPDADKPISVATAKAPIPADYFVYAMGPDSAKVKGLFDDKLLRDLVPAYDTSRQFGADGLATVIGLRSGATGDGTSLEIVGGTAARLADGVRYGWVGGQVDTVAEEVDKLRALRLAFTEAAKGQKDAGPAEAAIERLRAAAKTHLRELKAVVEAIDRSKAKGEVPAVPTHGFADLEALRTRELMLLLAQLERVSDPRGAQLRDVLARVESTLRRVKAFRGVVATYAAQVKAYHEAIERKERPADPRMAGAQMGGVISTLPLNVLMNDQLTSTRSEVEAAAVFTPGYVRTDVNFATDSASTLAQHIAVKYPRLGDRAVDEWVDRILRWRRPSEDDRRRYTSLWGPIPNPSGKPREDAASFGAWFERQLAEENRTAA
jgi:hypothetical protein